MIKRSLRNLTAASILAGATHGAIAQTPMPQTPTTKIGRRHLRPWRGHVAGSAHFADQFATPRSSISMARSTGGIDWKVGRVSSSFNIPTLDSARRAGGAALGKAHLITFQLTPIGPLNPLRRLLVPAVPH